MNENPGVDGGLSSAVLSTEQSTRKEVNPFHRMLAERSAAWVNEMTVSGKDPRHEIFRPENGLSKATVEEYFLHRLSVIGLPTNPTDINADFIGRTLHEHAEKINSRMATLTDAFAGFNESSQGLGFPEVNLDPNRIYFLSGARIAEIAGEADDVLARTLESDVGEILIADDDESTNNDDNQLYDVVVHELGHQARAAEGLDRNRSNLLEEGIIQDHARTIEKSHDRVSVRTTDIYWFEASVAKHLAGALGLKTLMNLSYDEIRGRMRERYFVPGQLSEPYDDLLFDLGEFRLKIRQADSLAAQATTNEAQMNDIKTVLTAERNALYKRWGFVSPQTQGQAAG